MIRFKIQKPNWPIFIFQCVCMGGMVLIAKYSGIPSWYSELVLLYGVAMWISGKHEERQSAKKD